MNENTVAARGAHLAIVPCVIGALALPASADIVDLSVNSSGTLNGALFERYDFRPAGTGFIDSFVRLQGLGTQTVEQGYNTSGRPVPFDANPSPNFTRDLRLGDVFIRSVDSTNYYEFLLDVNEPNSGNNRFISLDQLQIYTSSAGGQTSTNLDSLGTLVFAMNAAGSGDNWVKIDGNLGSGSGQYDMRLLVPVAAFAGAGPETFVYLYSMFGQNFAAQGGFEEWATVIPLPPSAYAGALCLMGIGIARLVRRQATA